MGARVARMTTPAGLISHRETNNQKAISQRKRSDDALHKLGSVRACGDRAGLMSGPRLTGWRQIGVSVLMSCPLNEPGGVTCGGAVHPARNDRRSTVTSSYPKLSEAT